MDSHDLGSSPSTRVVEQRIRNRIMEYLELASSFAQQLDYQDRVPNVSVPNEVIEQWEDWVPKDPRIDRKHSAVYTMDEVEVLCQFQSAWETTIDRTPNPLPPLPQCQALPPWRDLQQAAASALSVFARRGPMPEDREV